MLKKIKTKIINVKNIKNIKKILVTISSLVVFIVGGWFMLSGNNKEIVKSAQEIESLIHNITYYYMNRPDFWGLNTQTVIDKKLNLHNMVEENGKLISSLGNRVLVGAGINGEIVMPGTRSFDIVYKELNRKQCIALASYKFNDKFWLGITKVEIFDGKQLQSFSWSDKKFTLPIKSAKAKAFCGENNDLIWHWEQ